MRWGVIALACAACGGQGVDLEIDAEVTFDRVELFVTYDVCRDDNGAACDQGIGWPNQTSRPPGTIYVLRDDEKLISSTKIDGGSAVLHLEAASGFEDTKAIAVAAYQGNKVVAATVLWSPRIPLHSAERWKVHLDTTEDASVKLHEDPGDKPHHRALAWPREASPDVPDPSDYASCFVYQEWNGSEWDSKYFVPESDMDCDGSPPDCTPFWNHFDPEAARCVTKTPVAGFCALGTPACAGETPGTTCTPTTPGTCMPQEVCAQCGDATDLAACIRDQVTNATSLDALLTRAECTFRFETNVPGPCMTPFGNQASFVLAVPCTSNPNPVLRDPAMPFSGGSAMVMTPDGSTYAVSAEGDNTACAFTVEWKAGGAPLVSHFVLAFSLGTRTVLVPLTLGPAAMGGCDPNATSPDDCRITGPGGQDSLFQCIRG
ncbi:MAG: hypothetical protein HOV81_39210 [Kofleriaceae bacterium]|nr:hypothetical protein [Kofleriaceae bacterium]